MFDLSDSPRAGDVLHLYGQVVTPHQVVGAVAHEVVPQTVEGGIVRVAHHCAPSPARDLAACPLSGLTGTVEEGYVTGQITINFVDRMALKITLYQSRTRC